MTTRNTIARFLNRWMRKPEPAVADTSLDPNPAPDLEPETAAEPEPDLWLHHQEPWPGEKFDEPSLLHSAEPEAAAAPELVRWVREPEPAPAGPVLQPGLPPGAEPVPRAPAYAVTLVAHIEGAGDLPGTEDGWVGRASGPGRIEGFTAGSEAPGWQETVSFQSVLQDGSLGPMVPAGQYCGTQGQATPLHGFVLHAPADAPYFAAMSYEAMFQDGTRSEKLAPGAVCASPALAAVVAMRIAIGVAADTGPADWPGEPAAPLPVQATSDAPGLAAPTHLTVGDIDTIWAQNPPETRLAAHVSGIGDMENGPDGWVGTPAEKREVEGFEFTSGLPDWHRNVTYQAVLHDLTLGDIVAGGDYCGTRGKMLPMHGFVLHVSGDAPHLADMTYEGIFHDGFHSGVLRPGTICASPANTVLIGMRITLRATPPASGADTSALEAQFAPEPVRLVIWDLDETFWGGTLTEGGVAWREENAEIVRTLARRGIPSSICSKNDPADVFAVLDQHGMRDFFVSPSISWEPKGPRLAALVAALQLRAPTMLFIDDNPMNRAEAVSFVPGLQVCDETAVPALLEGSLLQGKPDPDMKRLAQYRLMERRQTDQARSGGDTGDFLRKSGITVSIEHDLALHLDRAIELINRTNQLNFTKTRLKEDPDNPEVARAELRALLEQFNVQAGILHVRDAYGDYGYCGFYATRREPVGGPELLHFAFSCRILGMGIETWLYRQLKRPRLRVAGAVLTDVFAEGPEIDWIGTELPGVPVVAAAKTTLPLRYVLLRGACDMRALSHYFTMIADQVIEEFDSARGGQTPLINHSLIATQAMHGIDPQAIEDWAPLGFIRDDFRTILAADPLPGPAAWLLGFTIERPVPLYRHKATGMLLPASVMSLDVSPAAMMRGAANKADPKVIAHLRENFEFFGCRPDDRIDDIFKDSLRQIFSRAGNDVKVFVLLGNARIINGDGSEGTSEGFRHHNALIAEVAANFPNVELLSPISFMTHAEMMALHSPHHFDRLVYFRIFRHIANRIGAHVETQ